MQMELARVPSEISASCTSYVAKCKSVFTVFACADVCVSKSDVLKLRLLNIMLQAVVYLHVCETEYLYKLGKLPYKVSSRSKDSYKCWHSKNSIAVRTPFRPALAAQTVTIR